MTGTCLFCGQSYLLSDEDERISEEKCRRLKVLQISNESYEATMNCRCKNAIGFSKIENQIQESYAAIDELLDDNPDVIPCAKVMAEQIAFGKMKNVNFSYDEFKINIRKKDGTLIIEKEHKVKESKEII